VNDEGVLDPWVTEWFEANAFMATPFETLDPEILELARGPAGGPVVREVASVEDGVVEGVPVRFYRPGGAPTGVVVYFHGGGFVIGSIGIMDNVARELAHATGATVISVNYRLAPEHPFPAGLDDCEAVTRWALANAADLGTDPGTGGRRAAVPVAVAGESAGGNLSAVVALRLREGGTHPLAGQVLIYPVVTSESDTTPSRERFADGPVISKRSRDLFWEAYRGGRDIDDDPHAAPLKAPDLSGLPPAIVLVGGCDPLRDEGRAYAGRLRDAGVEVEERSYPGQPHGFVNFDFPAAAELWTHVGTWVHAVFAQPPGPGPV
jgi:acetyl esterase